jgi:hypothetical protein
MIMATVLFTMAIFAQVLTMLNTLYADQANCQRFNQGQREREIVAHRHLGRPLSCSLILPQGTIK